MSYTKHEFAIAEEELELHGVPGFCHYEQYWATWSKISLLSRNLGCLEQNFAVMKREFGHCGAGFHCNGVELYVTWSMNLLLTSLSANFGAKPKLSCCDVRL